MMPYLGLKGNGLLAGVTCASGMAFILFGMFYSWALKKLEVLAKDTGYDDGVIGGLLDAPSFEDQFHLDSTMQGTVTSLFIVGAFLGCLLSAFLDGRWGRKVLSHTGSLTLSIGAMLQSSSYNVAQLFFGRIVAGVGLGLVVSNIIMWQSELSPHHIRGLLVACSLSFLILEQLIAYWLELSITSYASSFAWRFPMAFQAALALMTSALLMGMPESPRYLFQKDRTSEATEVLGLMYTHTRAVSMSESKLVGCLWLSTFVVIEIVPVAIENIGWKVYLIFACCNLAFIPFVYFFLPETAGLALESIDLCFMDRTTTPVKKASDLRRQMKQGGDITLDQALDGEKKMDIAAHVEHSTTA